MTDEQNVHHMWSEQELDQALAALNSEVPPGERALAQARTELMTAAGGPAQAEPVTPKRHWRRWVAATATVAAVTAAVLVVQTVSFGGKPPVASAAAQVLNAAADKIGASDPVVKPGQYLYIAKHSWNTSTIVHQKTLSYLRETVSEQWVPADRTQEWLLRSHATGQRKWISGTEADLQALGIGEFPRLDGDKLAKCGNYYDTANKPCPQEGSWQQPTQQFLASLPTDPKQLYDRLRADTADRGQDPDLEMLVYVADAIRTGLVPAAVRANLYRALALVPALEISDQSANLDGRVGIGLGVDRAGHKQELIIDRETGQYIGERDTATKEFEGTPAGTVTGYSSMTTGVASKLGDKPVS